MARIITTVTTTVKDKIPCHFICNYCGCRNDKLTTITGLSVGGRENVGGALLDLHDEPKRYREKIEAYRERLRAGDNLLGGLALFLVGAIANLNAVLSATFMAIGGLVEVSAIVGGPIIYFMRNRRARKARIAEIAAAPNDPDKLPVIEV